jgi:hypothetical protein
MTRVEFDETKALRDLLASDPRLAGKVIVGTDIDAETMTPVTEPPYVVIRRAITRTTQDRLTGPDVDRPSWTVSAAAESELAADAVLGWVDAKLRPDGRGVTLAVPGRRTNPFRRLERPGNATDFDVHPPVAYAIAVYGFESTRDPNES